MIVNQQVLSAVVLGGYVNGYSIIQELHEQRVSNIGLIDTGRSLARFSNKLSFVYGYDKTASDLLNVLNEIRKQYNYLVLFPTDDLQLELLYSIYDEVKDFCFCPFNEKNIIQCLDKNHQYAACSTVGIPFPKSVHINSAEMLVKVEELTFPIIVKPSKRDDLSVNVFRNLYIDSLSNFREKQQILCDFLQKDIEFIISEFIPGDDTHIYAYTAYRSKNGKIINEWIGKKLTQYPDEYGVFSSAANIAPEIIREQGRLLLNSMDIYGIAEPEFKYDARDGQYKLMEINLRSMMWHRLGNLTGINLQYTQWCDAIGLEPVIQEQDFSQIVHFVYFKHECINLFFRKKYLSHFKHNLKGGDKNVLAVFDGQDIKPFLFNSLQMLKEIINRWLKV